MCGIAGIIRFNSQESGTTDIRAMTRALAHRGPDGEGFLERPGVALGHRRLAIIDLETGAQPMSNEDGSVWVTFNGEIYNYRELRSELERQGHRFRTHSDTEVLVHGFEQWGNELPVRLRGMFAFGICDFARRIGLLARDPLGIKPLVYRHDGQRLLFASEINALQAVQQPARAGSLAALEYLLRFQYIPAPTTIYREIAKLPAAHFLEFDFDGHCGQPTQYWSLQFAPGTRADPGQWQDDLSAVLQDSVAAHLVSDVPFGVFLSGGLDSTAVAAYMAQALAQPVRAFAIDFDDDQYSELSWAREAADHCGIELHHETVRASSFDLVWQVLERYGEPFGDSSAIPTWCLSRLARQHVPMVLSGDGGDEGLAGYAHYGYWMRRKSWRDLPGELLRSPKPKWPSVVYQHLAGDERHERDLAEFYRMVSFWSQQFRAELWKPEFQTLVSQSCPRFDQASAAAHDFDRLSYAQSLDIATYLPDDILTKVDIASMAHGLEVRTPLVDRRVYDFAAQLPSSLRWAAGNGRPACGKVVLKQLLARTFRQEFVYRQKQGFAIPRHRWFYAGQPGRRLLEEWISDPRSAFHRWFSAPVVTELLSRHSPQRDYSNPLWVLLVACMWMERHPEVTFS